MWGFRRPRSTPAATRADRGDLDLAGAFGRARARVVERLRSVNQTTERETLAAGRSLEEVVKIGRDHIARLRDLLERKLGSDSAELTRAVQAQATKARSDLDTVSNALERHRSEVASAAAHAGQIASAANAIARLTSEARSLALNARIEAARSGDRARGFAVIADQMKRLSEAIAEANTTVNQLSKTLGASLPQLHEQSASLGAALTSLGEDLRTGIGGVEAQVQSLRADVAAALADSDHAIGQMVAASHAALSHLQFQDVCAQQLLSVDTWLHEVHASAAGTDDEVAAPTQVVVGSVDESPAHAGVVQLF